jgi:hypothetical protein
VRLVDQCQTRLKTLRSEEKLSGDAADALESIILEAQAGNWEPAQTHLSRFIEGQRR